MHMYFIFGKDNIMTKMEYYEARLAEEKKYEFPTFNRDDVWDLGCALVEAAGEAPGPLAVTIWLNGTEVFRYYPTGTGKNNERWLEWKRNTVTTLEIASMTYKARLAAYDMKQEDDGLSFPGYAACGGGFPIKLKGGAVIGFIGMSGLPDEEDHAALIAGLEKFFSKHF